MNPLGEYGEKAKEGVALNLLDGCPPLDGAKVQGWVEEMMAFDKVTEAEAFGLYKRLQQDEFEPEPESFTAEQVVDAMMRFPWYMKLEGVQEWADKDLRYMGRLPEGFNPFKLTTFQLNLQRLWTHLVPPQRTMHQVMIQRGMRYRNPVMFELYFGMGLGVDSSLSFDFIRKEVHMESWSDLEQGKYSYCRKVLFYMTDPERRGW